MELLIYTPLITSRIRYITEYIFKDYLLVDCRLTESETEFSMFSSAKLSYGTHPLSDELFIRQNPLLLQETIENQDIILFTYQELPAFFAADDSCSAFPFDVFAASFYLVSRYEEYLPHGNDKFGRFSPKNALAVAGNFLGKPLVNIWATWLWNELKERFANESFPQRKFDYLLTYDIDRPYAYVHKGSIGFAGLAKSLINRHFYESKKRMLTLLRLRKDPYDTYDFQFALQQQFGSRVHYFILCAHKSNQFEKKLHIRNRQIKNLIRRIAKYGETGIHPSFASDSDAGKIKKEILHLSELLGTPLKISRQHYLMLKLPQTYRALIANGIQEDYTMGYASRPGFRASVCTPFRWFDLEKNAVTELMVFPLTYMDGTLNDYMHLSRFDAQQIVRQLCDEVKAVNGMFISLWHNSSLSDSGHWQGWRSICKQSVEYAASLCPHEEES